MAIAGDPAPGTAQWAKTAGAIRRTRPDLLILLGDLVSHGRREALWEKDFFRPAERLFQRVPVLAVPGNHDEDSPLFWRMFSSDGRRPFLWTLRLGEAGFLGLDGAADWSPDSPGAMRLDAALQKLADCRWRFAFSHYPPFSLAGHGALAEDGLPRERPCRMAREALLPRLQATGFTAWFTGHNHVYERSELPGGLTLINTGGAGGYLYARSGLPAQNPHGVRYEAIHHFCLLEHSPTGVCLRTLPSVETISFR